MELLFVVLIGVGVGLIVLGAVARRRLIGVVLLPATGGAAAAVVWVALTWAGLRWDAPWIWAAALVCTALTTAATAALLLRVRDARDAGLFARVSGS